MKKLETIVNILVLVTCIVITVHFVSDMFTKNNAPRPPYKAGDKLVDTPDFGFHQAHQTLILFESSRCHFCAASMAFYTTVREAARKVGTRVIALTPEDIAANRTYLESQGVRPDAVASLAANRLAVRATPTLILVRRDGTVIRSWVGKLTPKGESEVIASLGPG